MATFTSNNEHAYTLEYAGVPFCLDAGEALRSPHRGRYRPTPGPAHATGPTKHQPEADLLDEVDRLLPFLYGQEFELPSDYPGRNVGALARREHVGPMPSARVRVGDWYYPTTASRWSVFRGLMTSTQVKAVLLATQASKPATFVMKAAPNGIRGSLRRRYDLESQLYLLPPRPLAEHGGGLDGLYLVTLVDERYYWQYQNISLGPVKESTWAGFVDALALQLGVVIEHDDVPAEYGQPEPDSQLWTHQENAAFLLDCVAANTGRTVVRKLDGTYRLMTAESSQIFVEENRGGSPPDLPSSRDSSRFFSLGQPARVAGGDLFEDDGRKYPAGALGKSKNAVLTPAVTVVFPQYVVGQDPVPHFVNQRLAGQLHGVHRPSAWWEDSWGGTYRIRVPLASGGGMVSGLGGTRIVPASGQLSGIAVTDVSSGTVASGLPLLSGYAVSGWAFAVHTTAKAFYSGEVQLSGDPLNVSGLRALAVRLATDHWEGQAAAALDESYPGTYAWSPEGLHDLVWTYSAKARGAWCRVLRCQWNQHVREFQHALPPVSGSVSGMVPPGVGGKSVAQSWRDSFSGAVRCALKTALTSGGLIAFLDDVGNFPTDQRWKGYIENEALLFEGTSGGLCSGAPGSEGSPVKIVYRGIDGTLVAAHGLVDVIQYTPGGADGVNYVKHGRGQLAFPAEHTSGGIQGVSLPAITQTVRTFTASGGLVDVNGTRRYYSGQILIPDPAHSDLFTSGAYCWVTERNGNGLRSGHRYAGQLAGYTPVFNSGAASGRGVAALYLVSQVVGYRYLCSAESGLVEQEVLLA